MSYILITASLLHTVNVPRLTIFLLSSQHIQKLRKARDTSALDGSGEGSKPSTPRKSTPRKTPTSGSKRKGEMDDDADELGLDIKNEDEAATKATPSKRVKNE